MVLVAVSHEQIVRIPPQRKFKPFALGDVHAAADDADDFAALVAPGRLVELEIQWPAGCVDGFLECFALAALHHLPVIFDDPGGDFRLAIQIIVVFADDCVDVDAEQLAIGFIDEHDATVAILDEEDIGRALDDGAKQQFLAYQVVFDPFAVCDVDEQHGDPGGSRVVDRMHAEAKPPAAALRPVIHAGWSSGSRDVSQRQQPLLVGIRNQIADPLADE